jgi:cellulose 1,4-beta-cellobiosidase
MAPIAVFAMVMSMLAAFPALAQSAACAVDYTVANEWPGGFTANVTITNTGPTINGWTLAWTFPDDQQIAQVWNATVATPGPAASVTNAGWNATIPSGGTASFGFNGTWTNDNIAPTAFTLNGTTCGDDPGEEPTDDPTEDPGEPGERMDNPYVGAQVYVNQTWSDNAASEPGGAAIADQPTAVWLDRISAIEGNDSPTTGSMG